MQRRLRERKRGEKDFEWTCAMLAMTRWRRPVGKEIDPPDKSYYGEENSRMECVKNSGPCGKLVRCHQSNGPDPEQPTASLGREK